MIIKGAIANGKGSFVIGDIEIMEPLGDEVLVEMIAAGICHTDWDSQSWGKPLLMGHEGAGIVAEVGPLVTKVIRGDKVILNWAIPCHNCFQCMEGNQHLCEINSPVIAGNKISGGHAGFEKTKYKGKPLERSFSLGTLSQFTLVREAALVKMKEDVPFVCGAIISCGVMTGYGSAVNVAKIKKQSSVVVIGAGGVGLNVIQGARISGANKIIVIDIQDNHLIMAKEFGATHTILSEADDEFLENATQKVKAITLGQGADYAFECTGKASLVAAPLAMIRNAGMAIQVSGCEKKVIIDMSLFEWDKTYVNPLYGKCTPQTDMNILQDLYLNGYLILDNMVTNTYPLEKLAYAFNDMHKGINAKGVIVF